MENVQEFCKHAEETALLNKHAKFRFFRTILVFLSPEIINVRWNLIAHMGTIFGLRQYLLS